MAARVIVIAGSLSTCVIFTAGIVLARVIFTAGMLPAVCFFCAGIVAARVMFFRWDFVCRCDFY